ncbi:MAG TPA: hypothetical protein VMY34_08765 [Acidimicrobiales bacterium]|nr:hypothetical protein [Acidimicrobiales bacterium]
MDETLIRKHVDAHADAVVRNDMTALLADFDPSLLPHVGTLAGALPQPVRSSEVLSLDASGTPAVALIKYVGDDKEITIRSEWSGDERPLITKAEPA